jgi:hypothetical protein
MGYNCLVEGAEHDGAKYLHVLKKMDGREVSMSRKSNGAPAFPTPLSAPRLLEIVRAAFRSIPEHRSGNGIAIPLVDALMSGLAIFGLKYPSLLDFDDHRNDTTVRHNLKTLYGVESAPCDTQLRSILDGVDPDRVRPAYVAVHELAERQGLFKQYEYLDGACLLSVDGTGHFSSGEIQCPQCCVKRHRDGSEEYYHQLLGAVVVRPGYKTVIPFAPEAILKEDGKEKNDCERNAAKRLMTKLKAEYPDLKLIVVEDGLAANGPHIKLLKSLGHHFIIVARPGDHEALFKAVDEKYARGEVEEFETVDDEGVVHGYRYVNGVALNGSHPDLNINFLEYWEVKKGKEGNWSWVTDFELNKETVERIMRGGRCRWKVENEAFNTLKNQGYHLEHNYGHGHQYLATVFGLLTFLAFLIDQLQEMGCGLFQQARQVRVSRISLWEHLRGLFMWFFIPSWEAVWRSIIHKHAAMGMVAINDTS